MYDQTANFLYIMDAANRRVMRWVPGASYGIPIIQASSMSNPRGMRFDSTGNIIIADGSMHRIIQFPITCRNIFFFDFSISSILFLFSAPAATTTTTPTRMFFTVLLRFFY